MVCAEGLLDEVRKRWRGLEGELWGLKAQTLHDLDRAEEARAAAEKALEIDPDCEAARELLDG